MERTSNPYPLSNFDTLSEIIWQPIYGDVTCHNQPEDRDLAGRLGLPISKRTAAPCLFIDVNGIEENGTNIEEARVAMNLLTQLIDYRKSNPDDVLVIVNHRKQKDFLQGKIKERGWNVSVETVDSSQGRENKIVIVLTTKTCDDDANKKTVLSKLQFVSDCHRATVAVSRCQHALYVLGQWKSLSKTPFWNQFKANVETHGCLVDSHDNEIVLPNTEYFSVIYVALTASEVNDNKLVERQAKTANLHTKDRNKRARIAKKNKKL